MLKKSFFDFNLSIELRNAIVEMGFVEPTPIQSLAIDPIMKGIDVIGQAQTGTGKTTAFGIPILERIKPSSKEVQAMILCPTRELAVQIAAEIKLLGKYKEGIHVLPVYGGQSIERQLSALQKGVQVVVGTPGRVRDHMERHALRLDQVRTVVLDEADRMLDMGFIDEMRFILGRIPPQHQTLLFSATMPKPILTLSQAFQNDPQMIRVTPEELTVAGVEQAYFEVKENEKTEVLARLIDAHNLKLVLVFCNTKRRVDVLMKRLKAKGYLADGLHGDMRQSQRDRVMAQFRGKRLEILVATDVAARGIDVSGIEVVVNYDLPRDEEYYVHRIGRTARAGRAGRAFTFVSGQEQVQLTQIQKYAKTRIYWQPIPAPNGKPRQIREDRREQKMNQLPREHLSSVASFPEGSSSEMARLCIALGRSQRIRPGDIVGAIAGETNLPGRMIGAIKIHDRHSFVDVPHSAAAEIIKIMSRALIKGHPVSIQPAKGKEAQT